MEKWADRSFMKFSKGKWKVLHLRWDNPTQRLRASWTENSSAEQDLEVLRDYRLNTRQQLTLLAKAVNQLLCSISKSVASRSGAMILLPAPCWGSGKCPDSEALPCCPGQPLWIPAPRPSSQLPCVTPWQTWSKYSQNNKHNSFCSSCCS